MFAKSFLTMLHDMWLTVKETPFYSAAFVALILLAETYYFTLFSIVIQFTAFSVLLQRKLVFDLVWFIVFGVNVALVIFSIAVVTTVTYFMTPVEASSVAVSTGPSFLIQLLMSLIRSLMLYVYVMYASIIVLPHFPAGLRISFINFKMLGLGKYYALSVVVLATIVNLIDQQLFFIAYFATVCWILRYLAEKPPKRKQKQAVKKLQHSHSM